MPADALSISSKLTGLITEGTRIWAEAPDEGFRSERIDIWRKRVYDVLADCDLLSETGGYFAASSVLNLEPSPSERFKARINRLKAIRESVDSNPEEYESPAPAASPRRMATNAGKIFVGHGRNKLWARVLVCLTTEFKLDAEAWESGCHAGFHVVDVLESAMERNSFAVIVVTADDATADGTSRARQNVVHEIGLFQGRLGFRRVAVLQQKGVEEFSNLAGLQVIPFEGDGIEATFHELRKMLEREGFFGGQNAARSTPA